MRLERHQYIEGREPLKSGNSLGQGTDGVVEVLLHPCRVTQNFRHEGLRLMEAPNKCSWGKEISLSHI